MKYTTYLFDLDGVLVDTTHIQYESIKNVIMDKLNYNICSNQEVNAVFESTITTIDKILYLSKIIDISDQMKDQIYTDKKKYADEYFSKLCIDYEKVELMNYLKINKCKIGVVTNSNKTSAAIILKNIGVFKYIDVLISNEDVTFKKPNPEPYLYAIKLLNSELNECVIFEDSEVGLQSAISTTCSYFKVSSYKEVNKRLIDALNSHKLIDGYLKPIIYIAHRGNVSGKNKIEENKPEYLLNAINKGYFVETDMWLINNKLYLGHDSPTYEIKIDFLLEIKDKLFCHCKNIEALDFLINKYPDIECFFHDNDDCTLTSKKKIWTYPGKKLYLSSICVMPEQTDQLPVNCLGVCTDNHELQEYNIDEIILY